MSVLMLLTQIFMGCTQSKPQLKFQYILSKDMVINESGCGYGTFVADEQTSAKPETFWNGQDKELCKAYKSSLIIKLLQKISITDVYLYCKESSEVIISAQPDKPGNIATKLALGWNKVTINSSSSFLSISFLKGSKLGEVLIDASQKYENVKIKSPEQKKVLMQDFIGTNAFVDVPLGLLEPFGCIREYHDWPDWNEPQKDSFHLNISKQGFDFQNFYVNLNKLGKTVVPTLQKSPKWLTGETNVQAKPITKNAIASDPATYSRHALYIHKYAENFSKPENGNVKYYENWNEHDKWWESGISYFSPYQYASMSSADKDGNQKKMGPNFGINNNGEKNKLVMAGLANPKTDYIHALKYWCDKNRKGDFAWDVINYHRYSNSAGLPDNQPKEGICPEKGNVYAEAKEIVDFRDKYLPNVEVWISEFGYDTENSPQQCKPIGQKNSELVQADWLIRSYILLSAAGIDKAFQYMIRDFAKSGLYATSGLYSMTLKDQPFLRPAWNYINTFKCALQGSYFEKLTVDSSANLYIAIYADKNNTSKKTKVIWLGTQTGQSREYNLKNDGEGTLIQFRENEACGFRKTISSSTISVSETPVIFAENGSGAPSSCYNLQLVPAKDLKVKDLYGLEVATLTDDQSTSNDPLFGLKAQNPASAWKTNYNSKGSNGIIFFLNALKRVHSLQLFDGAGTGDIQISTLSGNDWTIISTIKMNLYNKWKTVIVDSDVNEIKIEKVNGSPDVGEILIYEKVKY
ncbi:MAG: hypothetical protein H7329_03710 [Opitutaceae bacterium]|nr:hypothetical protein [Cytophagales bacterium]